MAIPINNHPTTAYNRGFTLLELIIVSALSAVVMLTIYSGFRSGILLWRRAQQKDINEEKIIIFYSKLAKDLSNTFVFSGIEFAGTSAEISFPVLVSTPVITQTESAPIFVKQPGRAVYKWDQKKQTIVYYQQDYSAIYQNKTDPPTRDLLKGIKQLVFKYYKYDREQKTFVWLDTWAETQQLPKAVKVEIKIQINNETEKTITRTISIQNG
jgi:prepilin-type N-terminal cleavage/methylation domain-containing protein